MGAFTTALVEGLGTSIASTGVAALGSALGGGTSFAAMKRNTREGYRLGKQYGYKPIEQYNWRKAEKRGLTPQEYYGSYSPGGPESTGAQVLGKAASDEGIQKQQAFYDANQKALDRQTSIQQTQMQTDASRDVAEIQAGTTRRGQDTTKEIANNILNLNTRELEQVKIPQAAATLGLTKQQLATEINKTAINSVKFLKEMKQMSMGPANLLVELTLRHHGISLADKSFTNLPAGKRKEIIDELIAMASSIYIEAKGTAAVGKDSVNSNVGNSVSDFISEILKQAGYIATGEGPMDIQGDPNRGPNKPAAPVGTAGNPTHAQSLYKRDARRTNPN